jgi:hypothetical protein
MHFFKIMNAFNTAVASTIITSNATATAREASLQWRYCSECRCHDPRVRPVVLSCIFRGFTQAIQRKGWLKQE